MSVLTDKERKEFLRKKQIARTKASLMAKNVVLVLEVVLLIVGKLIMKYLMR